MKKVLLLSVSLIFLSLCASFAQRSTITKFKGEPLCGVIVNGAFDVNISLGETTFAEVTLPDESINKLTFELTDDKYVRLAYGNDIQNVFVGRKKRPKARIVLSDLRYVYLSGSAMLVSSGNFTADKFVMTVTGLSFASAVLVDCNEAAIQGSGSAVIEDVRIKALRSASFEVEGSANVSVSGSAPTTKIRASTASMLDLVEFSTPDIEAVTSGTATIKAHVTGRATVTSSGMSVFRYIGIGTVSGGKSRKL